VSTDEELSGPELVERYVAEKSTSSRSRYVRRLFLLRFDQRFGLQTASRADVEAWSLPGFSWWR
jgi:hypothetical protein